MELVRRMTTTLYFITNGIARVSLLLWRKSARWGSEGHGKGCDTAMAGGVDGADGEDDIIL
jgi:hypothetical protein